MAEKTVEELKTIVETQKATIDTQTKSISEHQKSNAALTSEVKAKDATIKELNQKVEKLTKQNESLTSDVTKSGEVVVDLKKKLEEQAAKAAQEVVGGIKVHKYGNKRYRLLYTMSHKGKEVTDEVLKGNEELLAELVEGGSGAIEEIA